MRTGLAPRLPLTVLRARSARKTTHIARSLQRRTEAGADGFFQGRVFGVVLLGGQFGEPEAEDGVRVHISYSIINCKYL